MYLLDTNIVSLLDPRRQSTAPALVQWIARNGSSLHLSALTFFELEAGILKLRRQGKDKRTDELSAFVSRVAASFGDRVLPVDARVAVLAAEVSETARPTTLDVADILIAATAYAHGLTVLTRNLRHFAPTGVPALDPLAAVPPEAGR